MKKNSIRKVISIMLVFVLTFGMMSVSLAADKSVVQPSEPGVLEIYITPNGDKDIVSNGEIEANAGTRSNPVFSLEQAEQIVKAKDAEYQLSRKMQTKALDDSSLEPVEAVEKISKVNVHIGRGKYVGQRIKWENMPDDMTISIIGEEGVVFEGNGQGTFLEINGKGSNSTYNISGLTVNHYDSGIVAINWGAENPKISPDMLKVATTEPRYEHRISSSVLENMTRPIYLINCNYVTVQNNNIGYVTKAINNTYAGVTIGHETGGPGYGNKIFYNTIHHIGMNDNKVPDPNNTPAHFHGAYIAHNSDTNYVKWNKFSYIVGDPIKFRDGSDDNRVHYNSFWQTGIKAYAQVANQGENVGGVLQTERHCLSNQFTYNRVDMKSYTGGSMAYTRVVHPTGLSNGAVTYMDVLNPTSGVDMITNNNNSGTVSSAVDYYK